MTARAQLARCIAKYAPEIAATARAVLTRMRRLLPGAVELVYDNYNFLVVGFGPSERASEAIFSVVLSPRKVSLVFIRGVGLPDPSGLLRGGGKQVRNLPLKGPRTLDHPAVRLLMGNALARAVVPLDPTKRARIVIRSVSEKQRPRRPAPPKSRNASTMRA